MSLPSNEGSRPIRLWTPECYCYSQVDITYLTLVISVITVIVKKDFRWKKKNPIKINAVSDEYFGNFDCYLLFLHFYLCFSFLWTMSIMWKNEHEEAEVDLDYN